jgi:hypothetical protein
MTAPAAAAPPAVPAGFAVVYVKSDRKWRLGMRSEPYNKISEYFDKQLSQELQARGLRRLAAPPDGCCVLTIELLQVTSRPAVIKKPGIDVSANITVTGAGNRTVFSKGYRGDSKTFMNTWGHLINHAVESMAKSAAADEMLLQVLSRGSL